MKIIVVGNIGSGKTTILKKLNDYFHYDEIMIDGYRMEYGDGSLESEFLARNNFFLAIESGKNQFIECTGVGKVAEDLFQHLKKFNEPVILLILSVKKEVCLKRVEKRDWQIPFPFKTESISEKISRIEGALNIERIKNYLSTIDKLTVLSKNNETLIDMDLLITQMVPIIKQV